MPLPKRNTTRVSMAIHPSVRAWIMTEAIRLTNERKSYISIGDVVTILAVQQQPKLKPCLHELGIEQGE